MLNTSYTKHWCILQIQKYVNVIRQWKTNIIFSLNAFNTIISGTSYKRLCKRLGCRLDVRDHYILVIYTCTLVTNSVKQTVSSHRVRNFRVHSAIGQTSIALQQQHYCSNRDWHFTAVAEVFIWSDTVVISETPPTIIVSVSTIKLYSGKSR